MRGKWALASADGVSEALSGVLNVGLELDKAQSGVGGLRAQGGLDRDKDHLEKSSANVIFTFVL